MPKKSKIIIDTSADAVSETELDLSETDAEAKEEGLESELDPLTDEEADAGPEEAEAEIEPEDAELDEDVEDATEIALSVINTKPVKKNTEAPTVVETSFINEIIKDIPIVAPEDRITSEVMSKYEYAEVVGIRAKHIESGGTIFVDAGSESDPIKIAKKEIAERKCPLSIIRMVGNTAEIYSINELSEI